MDVEDVSDFLANLFMEEYALTFNIRSFYTAKKNQALIVNNFVYHLKTAKDEHIRWVCRDKDWR